MANMSKKRTLASKKKAGSSHPKAKGTPVRSGTPPQVGRQIATLVASGKSAKPPTGAKGKRNRGGAHGGANLVASNPVDIGERAVGGAKNGSPVFPSVYGGAPSVTKRPKPPRTRGTSGSGAAGAVS